jgi:predicted SprT family Zn-dependent metalloprotease
MNQKMTKPDVLEAVLLLASEFNIPTPSLKWNERTRNGVANPRKNSISLGHLAWRGVQDCMLHEFAHILAFQRHGKVKNHGKEFKTCLEEVIIAWLGDVRKYGWKTEYKYVVEHGRRRGAL